MRRLDECEAAAESAEHDRHLRDLLTPYFTVRKSTLLHTRIDKTLGERDAVAARQDAAEQRLRNLSGRKPIWRGNPRQRRRADDPTERDIADVSSSGTPRSRHSACMPDYVSNWPRSGHRRDVPCPADAIAVGDARRNRRAQGDAGQRIQRACCRDPPGRGQVGGAGSRTQEPRRPHQQHRSADGRDSRCPCAGVGLQPTDIPSPVNCSGSPTSSGTCPLNGSAGFALSLLVADEHYSAVSERVDRTNLRGRIVYFRVRNETRPAPQTDPRSLVHKLEVRPGTPFTAWLNAEAGRRFDLICARTPEEFRRSAGRSPATVRSSPAVTATRRMTGATLVTAGGTCWAGTTPVKRRALETARTSAGPCCSDWSTKPGHPFRSVRAGQPRTPDLRIAAAAHFSALDWRSDVARLGDTGKPVAAAAGMPMTHCGSSMNSCLTSRCRPRRPGIRCGLWTEARRAGHAHRGDRAQVVELEQQPMASPEECDLIRPFEPERICEWTPANRPKRVCAGNVAVPDR